LQQTVEAWRTVFYTSAAIYAFGTIFYSHCGSGEMQPWAKPSLPVVAVPETKTPAAEISIINVHNTTRDETIC